MLGNSSDRNSSNTVILLFSVFLFSCVQSTNGSGKETVSESIGSGVYLNDI